MSPILRPDIFLKIRRSALLTGLCGGSVTSSLPVQADTIDFASAALGADDTGELVFAVIQKTSAIVRLYDASGKLMAASPGLAKTRSYRRTDGGHPTHLNHCPADGHSQAASE